MIYLDYAATTPMSDLALQVYKEAAQRYFGNASSLHDHGTKAEEALQVCRKQHALFINGEAEGIYFTSGGSESNVLAIQSILKGYKDKGNHIITTEVEHASIYHLCKQLEDEGFELTYLGTNENGTIDLAELEAAIRPTTVLASIHHANGEIGALQDLEKIGEILARHDVIFHTDGVQTYGELPIDVAACKIDSLSVSSHKIYGPKGCGFCYLAPDIQWKAVYDNTTHEGGFRTGTVDVPSIMAFTAAAQEMMQTMENRQLQYEKMRQVFLEGMAALAPYVTVEQSLEGQLPQIVGLSFSQVQGQHIMLECNRQGICISTGSACQVGMQGPSRTMLAIGKTRAEATQFVRLSFGKATTISDIEKTVKVIREIVERVGEVK